MPQVLIRGCTASLVFALHRARMTLPVLPGAFLCAVRHEQGEVERGIAKRISPRKSSSSRA